MGNLTLWDSTFAHPRAQTGLAARHRQIFAAHSPSRKGTAVQLKYHLCEDSLMFATLIGGKQTHKHAARDRVSRSELGTYCKSRTGVQTAVSPNSPPAERCWRSSQGTGRQQRSKKSGCGRLLSTSPKSWQARNNNCCGSWRPLPQMYPALLRRPKGEASHNQGSPGQWSAVSVQATVQPTVQHGVTAPSAVSVFVAVQPSS